MEDALRSGHEKNVRRTRVVIIEAEREILLSGKRINAIDERVGRGDGLRGERRKKKNHADPTRIEFGSVQFETRP